MHLAFSLGRAGPPRAPTDVVVVRSDDHCFGRASVDPGSDVGRGNHLRNHLNTNGRACGFFRVLFQAFARGEVVHGDHGHSDGAHAAQEVQLGASVHGLKEDDGLGSVGARGIDALRQ